MDLRAVGGGIISWYSTTWPSHLKVIMGDTRIHKFTTPGEVRKALKYGTGSRGLWVLPPYYTYENKGITESFIKDILSRGWIIMIHLDKPDDWLHMIYNPIMDMGYSYFLFASSHTSGLSNRKVLKDIIPENIDFIVERDIKRDQSAYEKWIEVLTLYRYLTVES